MSNYSVSYIMRHKNAGQYAPGIDHGTQDAIAAAYWAGQASARAEERDANRRAVAAAPKSRYHRLVSRALAGVNTDAAEGLRSEAAEIGGWQHALR